MRKAVFGLLLSLTIPLVGCDEVSGNRVEIGQPAPGYSALNLAGDSVHLADLRGQVILLNVWATWCAPCREEMPDLQELSDRHIDRGLRVIGVSVDSHNERENVRRFAEDFAIRFAIWHDPDDLVGGRFRVIGVPSTFLIGRDGTLLWRHMGPITADDPGLHAVLREALDTAA